MSDYPLIVFATSSAPVPLAALYDLLVTEGAPANFGVDIAGEATEEELNDPNWEAAFLRWLEPEIHDVLLIERMVRAEDEDADLLVGTHSAGLLLSTDTAGRMIVADALMRTQVVYGVQILPAMIADEDHGAWEILDALASLLARAGEGLVYAEAEGYCDADGELMLAEDEGDERVSG